MSHDYEKEVEIFATRIGALIVGETPENASRLTPIIVNAIKKRDAQIAAMARAEAFEEAAKEFKNLAAVRLDRSRSTRNRRTSLLFAAEVCRIKAFQSTPVTQAKEKP